MEKLNKQIYVRINDEFEKELNILMKYYKFNKKSTFIRKIVHDEFIKLQLDKKDY